MLAFLYWLPSVRVLGQEVDVNPSADGLPGGATLQQLLDWAGQYGLLSSLGAMLAGGGLWAWSRFGSGGIRASVTGAALAAGGGVGALLVGLAPTLVNSLYDIAS